MSRWFRHYAGMARDDKIVRAALRAKQPVERAVWVWAAILESAAEIDDNGRFELDTCEVAYFLRADEDDIARLVDALEDGGRISGSHVVKWGDRQFQSDRSADRQQRYRDRQKASRDGADVGCAEESKRHADEGVTSPSRHGDAPETETYTETEETSLRSVSARAPRHDERRPSKAPSPKGTRLAPDWQPSSEDVEYAKGKGVPSDKLATVVEEFRNFWVSRAGKDGVKLDWAATFRNRVIQVCERNGWAPVANQGRAPPSVWVAADDPLWASVDARARMAGKPLVAIMSRHNGRGAYVPAEYLEPRAA